MLKVKHAQRVEEVRVLILHAARAGHAAQLAPC